MKKIVLMLLSVVMIITAFTACSKATVPETTTVNTYEEQTDYHDDYEEETEDYDVPEETTESQAEQSYIVPNDFVLEGKWKSVGDYGFGQAQPGAIVIFNGSNCNLFSPQDTYAYYLNNGQYVLDCTSFMSTDTVSFDIRIIDNDNIELVRGEYVTELMRVG